MPGGILGHDSIFDLAESTPSTPGHEPRTIVANVIVCLRFPSFERRLSGTAMRKRSGYDQQQVNFVAAAWTSALDDWKGRRTRRNHRFHSWAHRGTKHLGVCRPTR